jgi:hypothetical protein
VNYDEQIAAAIDWAAYCGQNGGGVDSLLNGLSDGTMLGIFPNPDLVTEGDMVRIMSAYTAGVTTSFPDSFDAADFDDDDWNDAS